MEAIKLLIIEDNPGDADLIQEMLTEDVITGQSGPRFRLIYADQLSSGLAHLNENSVDLILLDLCLPDSHGLATITRVRDHALDLPIIVLTGMDDEALGYKAIKDGAQSFLIKGEMTSRLLQRTIRYALERHRLIIKLKRQTQALLDSETRFHIEGSK